ncbi:MAG: HAD family hydrolase [Anaerococcus sp.]
MIKLFAFDLDGTVLDSNNMMNEETIKAFKKLDENGIKFIFATGRVSTSVAYLMEKTGIDNPFVANNGAISFLNKETILKETYLEIDTLKKLKDFANARNLYYHFYDLNTFYSEYLVKEKLVHLEKTESSGYKYQVNISISEDPVEQLMINQTKALKFQIFIDENLRGERDKIIEELKNEFKDDIYITSSADYLIEIMSNGVNKWQAILDIADTLGINNNEIAAIGDQDNDYLMVKNSEMGFAMGNATKSLKDIAKYIVKTNNELGVCEAIEKVLEFNRNV